MPASRGPLETWLRTALQAADAAAAVHVRWAGRLDSEEVRRKGHPADLVSRADLEAQEAALQVIRERHPDHAVMAEEDDGAPDGSPAPGEPLWVVDPLDGTTNFVHGHPAYAASVAVTVEGRPRAGAVSCAPTGERWWALEGGGAWKNGLRVSVSGTRRPLDALVGTGFPFKRPDEVERYARHLQAVLTSSGGVRRAGAAALDLCYLAEGRFDAFWELFLNPWDYAAGWLLVEEAGGVLCRVDGAPLGMEPGSVLAANGPELLEWLAELLAGV